MSPERKSRLEAIGFVSENARRELEDTKWNNMYQQLVQYHEQHGVRFHAEVDMHCTFYYFVN